MFGFGNLEKDIEVLQGYVDLNNAMYQEDTFKEQIDEFDKKYRDLHVKHLAKIKGYEKYTDQYIYVHRVTYIQKLFDQYYGLHDLARALKFYMMTHDKKVFINANMTLGQRRDELTVTEILLNEENAQHALRNMKLRKTSLDVYKRK